MLPTIMVHIDSDSWVYKIVVFCNDCKRYRVLPTILIHIDSDIVGYIKSSCSVMIARDIGCYQRFWST